MTKWLRSDTAKLAEVAGQVGLTPDEAVRAITIGARMHALGFNDWEIQYMIRTQFQLRADLERGYDSGTITPADFGKLSMIRDW